MGSQICQSWKGSKKTTDYRQQITENFVVCTYNAAEKNMPYKFEQLEVWQMSVEYIDLIYLLAEKLPKVEDFNLKSQIIRAATSVALNIAEGSTGQSNAEQARFLGMAIRSLVETVACQHIIRRRRYLADASLLDQAYSKSNELAKRLQAFRNSITKNPQTIRDESAPYFVEEL
jgi:four helix bundle protein